MQLVKLLFFAIFLKLTTSVFVPIGGGSTARIDADGQIQPKEPKLEEDSGILKYEGVFGGPADYAAFGEMKRSRRVKRLADDDFDLRNNFEAYKVPQDPIVDFNA